MRLIFFLLSSSFIILPMFAAMKKQDPVLADKSISRSQRNFMNACLSLGGDESLVRALCENVMLMFDQEIYTSLAEAIAPSGSPGLRVTPVRVVSVVAVAFPFKLNEQWTRIVQRDVISLINSFYSQKLSWNSKKAVKVNYGKLRQRIFDYATYVLQREFDLNTKEGSKRGMIIFESTERGRKRFSDSIAQKSMLARNEVYSALDPQEPYRMLDDQLDADCVYPEENNAMCDDAQQEEMKDDEEGMVSEKI